MIKFAQTKLFVVRTKKGEVVDLNQIGESLFKGARPRWIMSLKTHVSLLLLFVDPEVDWVIKTHMCPCFHYLAEPFQVWLRKSGRASCIGSSCCLVCVCQSL